MKRCYASHLEMAHVWIHSGVSGLYTPEHRCSTTETYFKSYNTVIAKRVWGEDVIIIDVSRYSNTTRKHQNSISSASSHLIQLYTYLSFNTSVEDNIAYYLRDMEAQITSLSKAKISRMPYSVYHTSKARLLDWCKFGGVDIPSEVHQLDLKVDEEYRAFVQRRAEADAKKEQKERERMVFIEAMRHRVERMRADAIPLWRQHKTINVDDYFDPVEQTRAKYLGVNLINGYYNYGFNAGRYNHIRLSKDGKYLETDGHATVPIREACVLCERLEKGRDVIGLKLGCYTVLEKTEDYLKIGCHKFQWSELEHLRAICANAS